MTTPHGFQHLLLTRFNVHFADRRVPTDAWLSRRLELFQRYTLPSVRSQTVQPDRWLVFSHVASPEWFKRELSNSLAAAPVSQVVWMEELWNSTPTTTAPVVSRLVAPYLMSGTTRVVTTRLDSDDAVARDFIEIIQAHCHEQTWEFLNLTNGAQSSNGKIYLRSDPANPFISLIESIGEGALPRTVYLDWHNRLPRYGPTRQIRKHPTWVQIVHGGNVQNAIHGIRTGAGAVAPHFEVDLGIQPAGRLALFADMLCTAAYLALRVVSRPHRIAWAMRVIGPQLHLRLLRRPSSRPNFQG